MIIQLTDVKNIVKSYKSASYKTIACWFGHHYYKMGDAVTRSNVLVPPSDVCGMKTLNRDAFKKNIRVPYILVPVEKLKETAKFLKPCFLKLPKLKNILDEGDRKKILLHPELFDENLLFVKKTMSYLNLEFRSTLDIELKYENWSPDSIFKAVLPPHTTGNVSGFSVVGHIIHLNLKPDLMEYRHLIGQVLLDKYSNIKTVVNKKRIIDNKFRNFQMELLAGEPNYQVIVKENGFLYAFDFLKVFWNPRLIHEHEEIVKKLNVGDLVYDVFAGVGPFAVPAAKKKCVVHANDLNPDSIKWLQHNAQLNKVDQNLNTYCLDGSEFIRNNIREGLIDLWSNDEQNHHMHIIMNLPGCALHFLKAFQGILNGVSVKNIRNMPTIYCYFFKKKDEDVSEILNKYLDESWLMTSKVTPVRLVAPNKHMMRVEYKIPKSVLFQEDTNLNSEPLPKRLKVEETKLTA